VIGPAVRRVREDEIDAVGALIAVSFNDLDADGYLVPPLAEREGVCGDYFTLYTRHAVDHGRVEVIQDGDGLLAAAVWFDRTRDLPEVADCERRLTDLTGSYLDRFQALAALFDEHHPNEPHWQHAFLGVHPRCRNMGLGSALLKHRHDEMDTVGLSQYLQASNRNSARLYRRNGYHAMNPCELTVLTGHRSSGCGAPPTREAV
jgi:ribosomal protein S18 acetylase RimI-like enzyme